VHDVALGNTMMDSRASGPTIGSLVAGRRAVVAGIGGEHATP